jgi:tetratricopeptide (TPR) repeat protein
MSLPRQALPPLPRAVTDDLQRADTWARNGELDKAAVTLEASLQKVPGRPEILHRLSVCRYLQGRFSEAALALQGVLHSVPNDPAIHNSLGGALAAAGEPQRAEASFRRACELAPGRADFWFNLGRSRESTDDSAGALIAYDRAVELAPDDSALRLSRVETLRALGQLVRAADDVRLVLARNPDSVRAWTALVSLKSIPLCAEELVMLESLHAKAVPHGADREALGFVLGQALEPAGRYAQAFACLEESNRAKAGRLGWRPEDISEFVDAMSVAFTSPTAQATDPDLGRDVVFLVGMPRSGSTLVEHVLSSHPEVAGAGELLDVHAVLSAESGLRGEDLASWLSRATPEHWTRLGCAYLERTAQHRKGSAVFTDKQLDNWRYVGVIRSMLPGARVVHCRRDPVEACWSCFKHSFRGNHAAFAYDFDHLARYHHDVERLMSFWRGRFPGLVFDHVYEHFVEAPDAGVRALLEACGLPFDVACLNFQTTQRSVRTASAGQVRQPLNRGTAIASYYGSLLDPLRHALAVSGNPSANGCA